MKKVRALLSKQGFFIMIVVCIALIGISGFWALSVKNNTQTELQVDSSPDFIQGMENAQQYRMIRPVDGDVQTAYATIAWQETLNRWGAHEAVDMSVAKGESVYSAQAGYVAAAYRDALWGGVVEIVHEQGLKTRTCGLSWPLQVLSGTEVVAGQIIGYVSAVPIESTMATHIHFEASIHDVAIDPTRYM